MVEAMGGVCKRVETGRQKLQPKEVGVMRLDGIYGSSADAGDKEKEDSGDVGKKRKRFAAGEEGVRAVWGDKEDFEDVKAAMLEGDLPTNDEYEKLPPLLLASLDAKDAEATVKTSTRSHLHNDWWKVSFHAHTLHESAAATVFFVRMFPDVGLALSPRCACTFTWSRLWCLRSETRRVLQMEMP